MPRRHPDLDRFPPAFKATRERLRCFLRYFATPAPKGCGRKLYPHHGIIYWPDLLLALRRSTVWFERFYPRDEAAKRRKQQGIPTTGAANVAWEDKDIRREVERLLRPLLIPTTSSVGSDYIAYAMDQRGAGDERINDVNQDVWQSLNDPNNYTFFRRVTPTPLVLTRILVDIAPLRDIPARESSLPIEIVAMYYAWRTLAARHRQPFDPAEVGIEWTDAGWLFVNWARFLQSPYRPPGTVTADMCATFLRGGYYSGRYRVRVAEFPEPKKHPTIPEATRAVDSEDFDEAISPCSIIDPLYIEDRPRIFSVRVHKRRTRSAARARAKTQDRLRRQRQWASLSTGDESPPPELRRQHQSRLYTFPFRPVDHLSARHAELPLWFDADYEEQVYAITFKKQLYFAAPEMLTRNMQDRAPAELQAWFYAMDSLACVEQFTESGHVGDTLNKSRSEQIRRLRDREYTQTATQIIKNFLSLNSLTAAQMRKVRRETVKRIGQDPTRAYPGHRWYQELVLSTARRSLGVSSVRRRAYTCIPTRNGGEPKLWPFYSEEALKLFRQAASGADADGAGADADGGVDDVDDDVVDILDGDADALRPPKTLAPYVYAWATFCLKARHHDRADLAARIAAPSDTGPWSPAEDFVLIRTYRAHPRMTPAERAELLRQLPRHSWKAAVRRVSLLNKLLEQILTVSRRHRYTVGKLWLDAQTDEQRDVEVKRLVVIIGIGLYLRYARYTLNRRLSQVSDVMALPPETVKGLLLPNSYHSERFLTLAKR